MASSVPVSFYDLSAKTPSGKEIAMREFEGKVVLIVNTATRCGLAPQFEGLEALHQQYKDQGLVILGFPCDQFAGQEPETNDSMEESCKINHGVTFQLTEKCEVNGGNAHPVFKYLKKELSGFLGGRVKWNFTKFVLDRKGTPRKRFAPVTKPEAMTDYVKQLLDS